MASEAHKIPDPGLPRRIGPYEAFVQIGAGGMARVYLAVRRGSASPDDIVVIKVLGREVVEDEQALAMFMDEARIATALRHPNIVRTREIVAQPPDYLLAMDYEPGQSLLEVLRRVGRDALPVDEHIWILIQILQALDHAHAVRDASGSPLGIVHRDVSPSNVLVCYTGEIKLFDFGIAKASGALAATLEGVIKGKLGYAAPEQCLGGQIDARADIYAVGVMLWEAIAQRRRASGETRRAVLRARIEDAEPRLEDVRADVPAELAAIVIRALGYAPTARYASAREFQLDLQTYLDTHHLRVTPAHIAARIAPHFDQDRVAQQRLIEAHLQKPEVPSSGEPPTAPPLVPSVPPRPSGMALRHGARTLSEDEDTSRIAVDASLLSSSRQPSTPPVSGSAAPPAEGAMPSDTYVETTVPGALEAGAQSRMLTRPLARYAMLAAGAVLVFFVALAVSIRRRTHDSAAAPVGSESASTLEPLAPTALAAGVSSAGHVRVRIAATPPEAELRLDGRLLRGNPFISTFPMDDAIHELRASADGFREQREVIQFLSDVNVEIALRESHRAPRTGARRVLGSPPPPARSAAPSTATAEPGTDLKQESNTRSRRTIDDADPYAH